jgi:hypothetical protein
MQALSPMFDGAVKDGSRNAGFMKTERLTPVYFQ